MLFLDNIGLREESDVISLLIKGVGTTATTSTLLIKDSADTQILEINDAGEVSFSNSTVSINSVYQDVALSVGGQFRLHDGTEVEGRVLVSGTDGLARWQDLTETSITRVVNDTFVADGVTTSFPASFDPDDIVYLAINGVIQRKNVHYTVSGQNIVISPALPSGYQINIVYFVGANLEVVEWNAIVNRPTGTENTILKWTSATDYGDSIITEDGTNGIGINDPSINGMVSIRGQGVTNATVAFNVEDATGDSMFRIFDDGSIEADGLSTIQERHFIFDSDLDTVSEHFFKGVYEITNTTLTAGLSSISYFVSDDNGATFTSQADITAINSWITANITGDNLTGTDWMLRIVATFNASETKTQNAKVLYK